MLWPGPARRATSPVVGRPPAHWPPSRNNSSPEAANVPPAGGPEAGRLAAGVVERRGEMVLAVELDEQPELGPRQVDPGDEPPVLVVDLELADGWREARDRPGQLHHQRLQQAFGRRCAWRS